MRTLVGIRPTGRLHIGHYFSVIEPALKEDADVLVATYHAPHLRYIESSVLRNQLIEYGVPERKIKMQQNTFDAHLYFDLLALARDGELRRMTQFKSKEKTAHMYTYPVLMAHDVYGYQKVIVGEDQKQHLEYAHVLLKRAGLVGPQGDYRGGRVMDLLDPTKKMSKSSPQGCLFLGDDYKTKLAKAVTTPEGIANLTYIGSHFGMTWDASHNQESKERLAAVLDMCIQKL